MNPLPIGFDVNGRRLFLDPRDRKTSTRPMSVKPHQPRRRLALCADCELASFGIKRRRNRPPKFQPTVPAAGQRLVDRNLTVAHTGSPSWPRGGRAPTREGVGSRPCTSSTEIAEDIFFQTRPRESPLPGAETRGPVRVSPCRPAKGVSFRRRLAAAL